MDKKYTIGVDFGSLSARAVLVDVSNGEPAVVGEAAYEHGIFHTKFNNRRIPSGMFLQQTIDYKKALKESVKSVLAESKTDPGQVIGIGIDSTSATLVSTDSSGCPLGEKAEFANDPFAQVLMWKSHAGPKEVADIIAAAEHFNEPFLTYLGRNVSDNLAVPKILHLLRNAPEVYEAAARFYDLSDWIVRILTGRDAINDTSAGGKFFWCPQTGFPGEDFFEMLDPRMRRIAADKLPKDVLPSWERAGVLTSQGAELTGLPAGIPVSPGHNDGMVPLLAVGLNRENCLSMAIGTGVASHVLSKQFVQIQGLYGLTNGAPYPDFYCYETGLHSFGDTLAWFVENICPKQFTDPVGGGNTFDLLNQSASALLPGESGLLALNWWNGNRSILLDGDLSGMIFGMNLKTKPEEIYRALIESFAFNYRLIIEQFENEGIAIDEVIAAGGIPMKNSFIIQLMCDILGKKICVPQSRQLPAIGSAIFAAVAAGKEWGGYQTSDEAITIMSVKKQVVYQPNKGVTKQYVPFYDMYVRLSYEYGQESGSPVKQLLAYKKAVQDQTD